MNNLIYVELTDDIQLNRTSKQYVSGYNGSFIDDKLAIVTPEPVVGGVNCLDFNGIDQLITIPPVPTRDLLVYEADVEFVVGMDGTIFFGGGTPLTGCGAFMYKHEGNARLAVRCATVAHDSYVQALLVISAMNPMFDGSMRHVVLAIDFVNKHVSFTVDGVLYADNVALIGIPAKDSIIEMLHKHNQGLLGTTIHAKGKRGKVSLTYDGIEHLTYPEQEGSGLPQDVSGNGNHATSNTGTWTTSDEIPSWNALNGFNHENIEMVSNKSFDEGSLDWVFDVGWAFVNGQAVYTGDGLYYLEQPVAVENGKTYSVTLTWTNTNGIGSLYISNGGFSDESVSIGRSGVDVTFDMLCVVEEDPLRFIPVAGWQGTIDYISLVETGKIPALLPALQEPMRPVGHFDSDYIDILDGGTLLSDSIFDISFEMNWNSSKFDTFIRQIYFSAGNGFLRLQKALSSNAFILWSRNVAGGDIISQTTMQITPDVDHKVRIVSDGYTVEYYVDGIEVATGVVNRNNFATETMVYNRICDAGAYTPDGRIGNFDIQMSSNSAYYKIDEGRGTNIIDYSGNGNDGTLVVGAGGLEAFWAEGIADSSYQLTDPSWNPITNDGGYVHNGSEVTITQTDPKLLSNTFWSNDGTTFDSKSYNDLITHDNNGNVIVGSDTNYISNINTISSDMVFGTRDGIDSTIIGNSISSTNCICGNGMVLDNGNISWTPVELITYIYTYDDGNGLKHYCSSNGTKYINGELTVSAFPFNINSDGIVNVTGVINSIYIFNEVKSAKWIMLDYKNEYKYW